VPIYRYRCENCGEEIEKIQSINSEPLKECEICGGKLKKMIGMVGIKFSGKGYYVTDNKKASIKTSVPETKKEDGKREDRKREDGKKEEKATVASSQARESSAKTSPEKDTTTKKAV